MKTIRNLPKFLRAIFLESDGLFCFFRICKFGSFKNLFATITILSKLYFRFRRFIMLLQVQKVISMNYGSSTSCWKPWRKNKFMTTFYGWDSAASRLQCHYEEGVHFLPLSSQKFLVLIWSSSDGWKAESTLELPSAFVLETPGLVP